MIKRVLSVLMTMTFIFCLLCVSTSAAEDFSPVLRFAVASDVHIADSGSDKEEAGLAKLFDVSFFAPFWVVKFKLV